MGPNEGESSDHVSVGAGATLWGALSEDRALIGALDSLLQVLVRGPLAAPETHVPHDSGDSSTWLQGLSDRRLHVVTSAALLQKYGLDTIAVAAHVLGRSWNGRFVDTCLVPSLEALAGGLPPVKRAANNALVVMADALGASPRGPGLNLVVVKPQEARIVELLESNTDYLVAGLAVRLRQLDRYPNTA